MMLDEDMWIHPSLLTVKTHFKIRVDLVTIAYQTFIQSKPPYNDYLDLTSDPLQPSLAKMV